MDDAGLKLLCTALFLWAASTAVVSKKRSDDVDVATLQNVVQQQSATIQTLQSRLTAMENTLQQQSSLIQSLQTKQTSTENSMQQQSSLIQTLQTKLSHTVAFSAMFSTSWHSENIGTRGVIKFHYVITNQGNGYNANTGVFTAPASGTYAFFLSIRSDNSHEWIDVVLEKNGNGLMYATAEAWSDVRYDKGTGLVTTHLNTGDTVLVRHHDGATYLEEWRYTTFSGFLISAD